MMKKFKKIFTKETADAVLTMGVISMMFIFLCVGVTIDISHAANLKNNFDSIAQTASETAIKTVKSNGSLDGSAAESFVEKYLDQRNGKVDGDTREVQTALSDSCKTVTVDGVKHTAPYFVISLDTKRSGDPTSNAVTYTYDNGHWTTPTLNYSTTYRVISADVYDTTANYFMGIFGRQCQQYDSKISSIVFGSNEDVN